MSKTNQKPDVCRLRCKTCRRPICTGARQMILDVAQRVAVGRLRAHPKTDTVKTVTEIEA